MSSHIYGFTCSLEGARLKKEWALSERDLLYFPTEIF